MAALLPESEIEAAMRALPDWRRERAEIVRTFTFADFGAALSFVNRIAGLAEAANHHPDIDIRWNKVILRLSTHSQGGLTTRDFTLARNIDAA